MDYSDRTSGTSKGMNKEKGCFQTRSELGRRRETSRTILLILSSVGQENKHADRGGRMGMIGPQCDFSKTF